MFEGFDERRIKTSDADLYVRLGGAGPPLLLLHGYPQTHVAWHLVAPRLMEDFTLVVPDLRGYGASRGPAPDPDHINYSKRAMAQDMVAVMESLGHRRFRVAGHDRGGRVGYRLCLDHPDRAERFAAIDIIPTLDVWDEMDADKALATYHWQFLAVPPPVPERLIGNDPAFYITHLLDRWAGRPNALAADAVATYIQQFHDPAVVAATCADYRAGATVDRRHDLADREAGRRIACPVLVVWGRGYLGDKAASPAGTWRRWADHVEEVVLDCGHFVAEEAPTQCAEALKKFFA
ncbi:MAG: alpha/beta hydrolase [Alphaproteobacteria bacterium]|nr:alpha/beta hydrolase [Alphaproteobacteria bacterium]